MHSFMALALLAATAPEAVILKPVANMYAQPTTDAEVVSQAIYGTNIGVLETQPGLPYTWGGASSFGYDCSGFTQMLGRRRGAPIPRDADVQSAWPGVVAVKREDLQPGDLLFFGADAGHITHTGMYIGAGKFINATTWIRPVVQICDLGDPHWTRLLAASRRLN